MTKHLTTIIGKLNIWKGIGSPSKPILRYEKVCRSPWKANWSYGREFKHHYRQIEYINVFNNTNKNIKNKSKGHETIIKCKSIFWAHLYQKGMCHTMALPCHAIYIIIKKGS